MEKSVIHNIVMDWRSSPGALFSIDEIGVFYNRRALMSGTMNKVMLIGNLARDPESRALSDGGSVVNMTVVTSRSWVDKATNERVNKPQFHRVTIWNDRLCDVAMRFLRKGRKVYISGEMEYGKYVNQSGQDVPTANVVINRFVGELQILDRENANNDHEAPAHGDPGRENDGHDGAYQGAHNEVSAGRGQPDLDDDIPF